MKLLLLLFLLSLWLGPASAQGVVTVEEGADAILPCRSNSSVQEFDWKKEKAEEKGESKDKEVFLYTRGTHNNNSQDDKFKSRITFFKNELINRNASIKILSTNLEDNGTYICILGPLDNPSKQKIYITLHVGAAKLPQVHKVKGTGEWSLLQCNVNGVPEPKVHWIDSSGNVLNSEEPKVTERDKLFYITSELYVYKTGNYTCVATQQTIRHQINNTIYENIEGSKFPWIIACIVLSVVLVLVVLVVFIIVKCKMRQQ